MQIRWLGHACFVIKLAGGKTIITDPFDEKVGYPVPGIQADIVTVSHQHFDHNAVHVVPGKPQVVQEKGKHQFDDVVITGIPCFHDDVGGTKRGGNLIFVIQAEGLKICHLGDLGHIPTPEQVTRIGVVDLLMVPVGGHFTIGAEEAFQVVQVLKPKIVLPMHYKTKYLDFPIRSVDDFLGHFPGYRKMHKLVVNLDETAGEMKVVLLELASE
jgi:L-ascorbate metabolism protein UlaG (beta-lactamase superfamily)